MPPTVREATPADAARMITVQEAAVRTRGTDAYTREQVEAWASDRNPDEYPITSPETEVLVAERDETVVGFGWLKPEADDYFDADVAGEITAVYVHPAAAREGVGATIYARLEKVARKENLDSLGLWASLNAVPFYELQGFEPVTEQSLEFESGVAVDVLEMKKELRRE